MPRSKPLPALDRRTADASRVGCGWYALGCLLKVDPSALKQAAREELGIRRPLGLAWNEVVRVAALAGWRAGHAHGRTLSLRTVADWQRDRTLRDKRILVCSHNHYLGLRGSLIFDSARMRRPRAVRVRRAWVLERIEA